MNERKPPLGVVVLAALLALTACQTHAPAPRAAALAGSATPRAEDVAHGAIVFRENCAACHGTIGVEGGVGPSLRGERTRKNDARARAWIEHPDPPMPKLYPGTLDRRDVRDVAAYVETL